MPLFLNDDQRKVLADIGIAAGQITAGSMVLPFLIPGLDQSRVVMIISGIIITIALWTFSVMIVKKKG